VPAAVAIKVRWQDRAHFFAASAQVMRRILVKHARRHNLKRGGCLSHASLDEVAVMGGAGRLTWSRRMTP